METSIYICVCVGVVSIPIKPFMNKNFSLVYVITHECLIVWNRQLEILEMYKKGREHSDKEFPCQPSPGAQGKWICRPMQETRVWSLVQEDSTCCGATEPGGHNCWACALGPRSCNYRSPRALEPCSTAREPAQWEAQTPQLESRPAHHNHREPGLQPRPSTSKDE